MSRLRQETWEKFQCEKKILEQQQELRELRAQVAELLSRRVV